MRHCAASLPSKRTASLRNGRSPPPRDTPPSNDRRGNSKPAGTGSLLTFQNKLQKHSSAFYIRHFTLRPPRRRVSSPRKKLVSVGVICPERCRSTPASKHGQSEAKCANRAKKMFFTSGLEKYTRTSGEEKNSGKKGTESKEGQAS